MQTSTYKTNEDFATVIVLSTMSKTDLMVYFTGHDQCCLFKYTESTGKAIQMTKAMRVIKTLNCCNRDKWVESSGCGTRARSINQVGRLQPHAVMKAVGSRETNKDKESL